MSATDEKDFGMNSGSSLMPLNQIQGMIFTVRGVQVILDRDLANVYGVENKHLNEQVRRNINRFPETFRFQLTDSEKGELVANCDRFASLKHATSNPRPSVFKHSLPRTTATLYRGLPPPRRNGSRFRYAPSAAIAASLCCEAGLLQTNLYTTVRLF